MQIRVGSRVYIASTGTGEVLELSYPSMRLAQRHRLFTEREHVNTLSPSVTSPGHLWAMLHGKAGSTQPMLTLIKSVPSAFFSRCFEIVDAW
jgi:hypothetical protein